MSPADAVHGAQGVAVSPSQEHALVISGDNAVSLVALAGDVTAPVSIDFVRSAGRHVLLLSASAGTGVRASQPAGERKRGGVGRAQLATTFLDQGYGCHVTDVFSDMLE